MGQTIVAVSSAPGRAALGILRLSGPGAILIAEALTRIPGGLSGVRPAGHASGEALVGDDVSVPARLYLFRAPRSYTREDLVELQVPGSPVLLAMLRDRAMARGALAALPGEFTARALLSGAMDASKAEAVAGVIAAQTDTQLRAARRMMDGDFAREIAGLRDELSELLALVEADIDFAEEPIEFITPPALAGRLGAITSKLSRLLGTAHSLERVGAQPRILLIGPPNAGKSSLMNALSGIERAICAAVAGTTRDILSAPVRLGREEVVLLDSAGVDETQDEIIARARELTLREADRVESLCVVIDATEAPPTSFLDRVRGLGVPRVVALNKIDLAAAAGGEGLALQTRVVEALGPVVPVSAATGAGLQELRLQLAATLVDGSVTIGGESLIMSRRQQTALMEADGALGRAVDLCATAVETIDCADVLAFELREALDALGAVTGDVTTEDLLTQIFSKFCIGK